MKLAGVGEVVLADTVGFVRCAYRTNWWPLSARRCRRRGTPTLLLHVVDASDPQRNERIEQVREVLKSIGAG